MENTNNDQFIDRATGEIYDKDEYYLRSRKQVEAYLKTVNCMRRKYYSYFIPTLIHGNFIAIIIQLNIW